MKSYRSKFMIPLALATVLLIPVAPQAMAQKQWAFVSVEQSRGLPIRGQSKNSVQSNFGAPLSSKPAVGKPPISSWVYPDFTVYFEYSHVITTVATSDSLPAKLENIQ